MTKSQEQPRQAQPPEGVSPRDEFWWGIGYDSGWEAGYIRCLEDAERYEDPNPERDNNGCMIFRRSA